MSRKKKDMLIIFWKKEISKAPLNLPKWGDMSVGLGKEMSHVECTFGGICNFVVKHSQILNLMKIKNSNTIAAQ